MLMELRHKYFTIIKSLYYEFYEEGQCGPDALIVLMEAADRAIDLENEPIKDWEFIQSYFLSGKVLRFIGTLSKIPMIGKLFSSYMFKHFSFTYDVCVNFIEAHEEATKMLVNVVIESVYSNQIKNESMPNMLAAENYMHKNIVETFPEITKAIQHRKAEYYLLIHELHFIDDMLKKGQIEAKEAQTLKDEIDSKIFYLVSHSPEIKIEDHKSRLTYASDISDIFDSHELKIALSKMGKEQILNKEEKFVGNDTKGDYIYYVARGIMIEKPGELQDTQDPSLKLKKG
jgi:hypothetical protein